MGTWTESFLMYSVIIICAVSIVIALLLLLSTLNHRIKRR